LTLIGIASALIVLLSNACIGCDLQCPDPRPINHARTQKPGNKAVLLFAAIFWCALQI
jgi:hypothetical protein